MRFGLPRSLPLRAALFHAAAAVLICLVGTWAGTRFIDARLTEQLALELRAEAEGLRRSAEKYQLDLAELIGELRLSAPRSAATQWLLQSEDRVMFGELPPSADRPQGRHRLRISPKPKADAPAAPELEVELLAYGVTLPGGAYMAVAAELRPLHLAALQLAVPSLLVGLLAGATALAVGFLSTRRLERRLREVSAVAAEVMRGNLAHRLPVRRNGDEIDRLAETVNAMLARIETLVVELREVSDDIAHDLRSPLSRLRIRLEAARDRARDPEADQAALAAALQELDAALALFSAMLEAAQMRAGSAAPAQRVDLGALATEVGEIFGPAVEEEGGALVVAAAPGLFVLGQPELLQDAIANLINNARVHAGPGPRMRLVVERLAAGRIALSLADDGPGIPAAERVQVVRRFHRLARSEGRPGHGRGLARVATIAEAHGAALTLADAGPDPARPGLLAQMEFPAAP